MPNEHILIIDDDADLCEALRLMLEPAGYRVTSCPTGEEGMACLRADRPDLILLDIMLGSPSEGFHIAYRLRKDDAFKTIPIVMVSSIGEKMGMDYARELGSDYMPVEAFLDKPLRAEHVLDVVRKTLDEGVKT